MWQPDSYLSSVSSSNYLYSQIKPHSNNYNASDYVEETSFRIPGLIRGIRSKNEDNIKHVIFFITNWEGPKNSICFLNESYSWEYNLWQPSMICNKWDPTSLWWETESKMVKDNDDRSAWALSGMWRAHIHISDMFINPDLGGKAGRACSRSCTHPERILRQLEQAPEVVHRQRGCGR